MFGRILWKQKKECLSAVLQRQPAYWKTGQVQEVPPDPVPGAITQW